MMNFLQRAGRHKYVVFGIAGAITGAYCYTNHVPVLGIARMGSTVATVNPIFIIFTYELIQILFDRQLILYIFIQ